MNVSLIRPMDQWGVWVISAILLCACNSNRKAAENTAQSFLQAYYIDLDFEKAKSLCSSVSQEAIDDQAAMVSLNPYAKDETPNIVVRKTEINPDNPALAKCTYHYNRVERVLPLRRLNNVWVVDLGGNTVESASSGGGFVTLSQDGTNGFASSASGEVTYRKRRQGNN